MREIVLSDHAGDLLSQSERSFQAADRGAGAWHDAYQSAAHEVTLARRDKSWWRRVLSVTTPRERAAQAEACRAHTQFAAATAVSLQWRRRSRPT